MTYLLSLMAGMLISIMVVFNGGLSDRLGLMAAMLVIHLVGLATISLVLLFKGERPRLRGLPLPLMTAGLLGVLTTTFNNYAFGRISVSAIMALALMGDSLSGLVVDYYGLLGMPRRPFNQRKLWGLMLTLLGIAAMVSGRFALLPVLLSLLAGLTILLSRLLNGAMARLSHPRNSTFINYLVGLLGTLLLMLLWRDGAGLSALPGMPPQLLLGGVIGALMVLLTSHIVGRISSYYMSLTLFVGQVSASLLLDMLLDQGFPWRNLLGGACVLAGLMLNLWQDKQMSAAAKSRAPAHQPAP